MTAAIIFLCHPVEPAWDPLRTTKQQRILFGSFTLAYEVSNIVVDLAILPLPVHMSMIGVLYLSTGQKWYLSLVFPLGGLYVYPARLHMGLWTNRSSVYVTGTLRVLYSYNPREPFAGKVFQLQIYPSYI